MTLTLRVAERIHGWLGHDWGAGNAGVPANHLSWRGRSVQAFTGNDAFTLNLHHPDSMQVSTQIDRRDVAGLVWFLVWRWWIVGEWCGVRRRVWYWALSRIVRSYRDDRP